MDEQFQFQGQRRQLVAYLKQCGISDEKVLNAIGQVPRQLFFDPMFHMYAYEDRPFSIGGGQTISQPSTVAWQSQLLDIKPRHKVLEIGTGSGYQAAILDHLGAKVHTIERLRELYVKAKQLLGNLAPRVECYYGDGYKGLPIHAPFDRIIVTAAAPSLPQMLFEQLKVGGKMIIPIDIDDNNQEMVLLEKTSDTEYVETKHGVYSFVPMLEDRIAK